MPGKPSMRRRAGGVVSGRGNSLCKGPEAGSILAGSENGKKSMAGVDEQGDVGEERAEE